MGKIIAKPPSFGPILAPIRARTGGPAARLWMDGKKGGGARPRPGAALRGTGEARETSPQVRVERTSDRKCDRFRDSAAPSYAPGGARRPPTRRLPESEAAGRPTQVPPFVRSPYSGLAVGASQFVAPGRR